MGAIQMANPKLARQVEEFIVDYYLKGQIKYVDFDMFKKIVETILAKKRI